MRGKFSNSWSWCPLRITILSIPAQGKYISGKSIYVCFPPTDITWRAYLRYLRHKPQLTEFGTSREQQHLPKYSLSAPPHFSLELKHTIKERFGCWRATRDVDIYRNDPYMSIHQSSYCATITAAVSTYGHIHAQQSTSNDNSHPHWHRNPLK